MLALRRRQAAARATKNRSRRLTPLCGFVSATFCAPAKIKACGIDCLYFCLFRRPKRRQHPERYVQWRLDLK